MDNRNPNKAKTEVTQGIEVTQDEMKAIDLYEKNYVEDRFWDEEVKCSLIAQKLSSLAMAQDQTVAKKARTALKNAIKSHKDRSIMIKVAKQLAHSNSDNQLIAIYFYQKAYSECRFWDEEKQCHEAMKGLQELTLSTDHHVSEIARHNLTHVVKQSKDRFIMLELAQGLSKSEDPANQLTAIHFYEKSYKECRFWDEEKHCYEAMRGLQKLTLSTDKEVSKKARISLTNTIQQSKDRFIMLELAPGLSTSEDPANQLAAIHFYEKSYKECRFWDEEKQCHEAMIGLQKLTFNPIKEISEKARTSLISTIMQSNDRFIMLNLAKSLSTSPDAANQLAAIHFYEKSYKEFYFWREEKLAKNSTDGLKELYMRSSLEAVRKKAHLVFAQFDHMAAQLLAADRLVKEEKYSEGFNLYLSLLSELSSGTEFNSEHFKALFESINNLLKKGDVLFTPRALDAMLDVLLKISKNKTIFDKSKDDIVHLIPLMEEQIIAAEKKEFSPAILALQDKLADIEETISGHISIARREKIYVNSTDVPSDEKSSSLNYKDKYLHSLRSTAKELIETDSKQGLELFEKGIELGDEQAAFSVAQFYESSGNILKSFDYYERGFRLLVQRPEVTILNAHGLFREPLTYYPERMAKLFEIIIDHPGHKEKDLLHAAGNYFLKVKNLELAKDCFLQLMDKIELPLSERLSGIERFKKTIVAHKVHEQIEKIKQDVNQEYKGKSELKKMSELEKRIKKVEGEVEQEWKNNTEIQNKVKKLEAEFYNQKIEHLRNELAKTDAGEPPHVHLQKASLLFQLFSAVENIKAAGGTVNQRVLEEAINRWIVRYGRMEEGSVLDAKGEKEGFSALNELTKNLFQHKILEYHLMENPAATHLRNQLLKTWKGEEVRRFSVDSEVREMLVPAKLVVSQYMQSSLYQEEYKMQEALLLGKVLSDKERSQLKELETKRIQCLGTILNGLRACKNHHSYIDYLKGKGIDIDKLEKESMEALSNLEVSSNGELASAILKRETIFRITKSSWFTRDTKALAQFASEDQLLALEFLEKTQSPNNLQAIVLQIKILILTYDIKKAAERFQLSEHQISHLRDEAMKKLQTQARTNPHRECKEMANVGLAIISNPKLEDDLNQSNFHSDDFIFKHLATEAQQHHVQQALSSLYTIDPQYLHQQVLETSPLPVNDNRLESKEEYKLIDNTLIFNSDYREQVLKNKSAYTDQDIEKVQRIHQAVLANQQILREKANREQDAKVEVEMNGNKVKHLVTQPANDGRIFPATPKQPKGLDEDQTTVKKPKNPPKVLIAGKGGG